MASKNEGGKGNPAAKRIGNAARMARRGVSWARGGRRKEARRQAQAEQEQNNRELSRQGMDTPWQAAVRARAVRRAADLVVQERARRWEVRRAA